MAHHFHGKVADIFDLQDRVTSQVVGAIAPELGRAEIRRAQRKPTASLDAHDWFMRGIAAFNRTTREANTEAMAMLLRAAELDPDDAAAWAMAARCCRQRKGFGWVDDPRDEAATAERLARIAADPDAEDAIALAAAGFTRTVVLNEPDEGAALLRRALELDSNLAWAHMFLSWNLGYLGEPQAALEHARVALRLSPEDPHMFGIQSAHAQAHLFLGQLDEALTWAKASVRQRSNFLIGQCMVAITAALSGQSEEATRALARVREIDPRVSPESLAPVLPLRRAEDQELFADGLRRAGLGD